MTISWAKVLLVACKANAVKTMAVALKMLAGPLRRTVLLGFNSKFYLFTKWIFYDEVSELLRLKHVGHR